MSSVTPPVGSSPHWSFEQLYERYQGPIHSYLYHLVGDDQLADDLTQDTFIKVFRALPKLDASAKINAWLYRIAQNTAYDTLRRKKLVAWLSFEDLESEPLDPTGIDPEVMCGEVDLVHRALQRMPTGYRAALLLYTQEGRSYAEIAQAVHIAEKGVKMYLSRARKAFRKHYQTIELESCCSS